MIEEITEDEARAQLETNLFGALWVTQAALPIMREQGSGHIVQVSSIGGISAFPTVGIYHASKWALEGFSQSMAQEVAGFGIKVTLVEPGGFSTDWSGPSASRSDELEAYAEVREAALADASTLLGVDLAERHLVGFGRATWDAPRRAEAAAVVEPVVEVVQAGGAVAGRGLAAIVAHSRRQAATLVAALSSPPPRD